MSPLNITFQDAEQEKSQTSPTLLLKDDIEKGDLNRPEMTAKLVYTLENAMHRTMQEKQYSAVAINAKVLMKLVGLEAKTQIR